MSDAKAKAEARRAKILARDKSKTVTAIGTTEEDVRITFLILFLLPFCYCLLVEFISFLNRDERQGKANCCSKKYDFSERRRRRFRFPGSHR
jgi:hypothetical protein